MKKLMTICCVTVILMGSMLQGATWYPSTVEFLNEPPADFPETESVDMQSFEQLEADYGIIFLDDDTIMSPATSPVNEKKVARDPSNRSPITVQFTDPVNVFGMFIYDWGDHDLDADAKLTVTYIDDTTSVFVFQDPDPANVETGTNSYKRFFGVSSDKLIKEIAFGKTISSEDGFAVWGLKIGRYPPVEMVLIPGGEFEMGDHHGDGEADELPIHDVYLDSFFMGKYEITNQQYCDFLNSANVKIHGGAVYASSDSSISYRYCSTSISDADSQIDFNDPGFSVRIKDGRDMSNDPMVEVTWYGAAAYCNWLSEQDGLQSCYNLSTWECDFIKNGYRLATEAEWEYAARGGEHSPYYRYPWGDTIDGSMANYVESGDPYETGTSPKTTPVGFYDGTTKYKADYNWPGSVTSYQTTSGANGYGLYDMAGNVWEWCNDWYDSNYYNTSAYDNPTGPANGTNRVMRSVTWFYGTSYCRVASRAYQGPGGTGSGDGFRVARNVVLDDGLVAYWSFDDAGDPGHDDSGNGHDGSVHGAMPEDSVCGNALEFDGVNHYVEVPDSPGLDLVGDFSIAVWMNPESHFVDPDMHRRRIITKHLQHSNNEGSWGTWFLEDGRIEFINLAGDTGTWLYLPTDSPVPLHQWTHIALIYSQADQIFRMYINGLLDIEHSNVDFDIRDTTRPLRIGLQEGYPEGPFEGQLDEVRIYDRALSPGEIAELACECREEAAGKLLVRSHNGSDWDLYIMDEDGCNLQVIDDSSANTMWGEISPDGQTVLYMFMNGSMYDFYQVPVTGGTPVLVVAGLTNECLVAWGDTPDHFFYNLNTAGSCGSVQREVHRRTLDGSVDEAVLSALNVYFTDVREDLGVMVCNDLIPATCWAGNMALVTYNVDGTGRHVLTATQDGKADSSAKISPDGQYIAFAKNEAGGYGNPHNIYRIRWDGTGQERVTNYVGDYKALYPVWRDNDTVFYSVGETLNEDNQVLRRYNISSGDDVVIPVCLPNAQPVDFLMVQEVQPDIDVSPLTYDFGDVEIGSSTTTFVTVSNTGEGDLTIDSIDFQPGGSSYFTVTSAPTLPATVTPGGTVDIEITFAPLEVYYSLAILEIASNDSDELIVEVILGGVGVVIEIPPSEQVGEILDFIDESVEDGNLAGDGPGNSAEKRLNALINMVNAAGDLIRDGLYEEAYQQLQDVYKKCDGQSPPPDFVTGPAASELASKIQHLMNIIQGAVIVSVDGISKQSTILGLTTGLSWPWDDAENYLGTALATTSLQNYNVELVYFPWSRDPGWAPLGNTFWEVRELRDLLREQFNLAVSQDKKFIVIAHSWGTVLSYCALSDLSQGDNPVQCDLYITLSSPLGTYFAHDDLFPQEIIINGFTNEWLATLSIDPFGDWLGYPLTDTHINYWAWGDVISGPLDPFLGDVVDTNVDPDGSETGNAERDFGTTLHDSETTGWHKFTSLHSGGLMDNQSLLDAVDDLILQTLAD